MASTQVPSRLPDPSSIGAAPSSDTGNKVSSGVCSLACAAADAPSSIRACLPSQRQIPKMLRTVRTTLVQVSAACPVINPFAIQHRDPSRKTQKP